MGAIVGYPPVVILTRDLLGNCLVRMMVGALRTLDRRRHLRRPRAAVMRGAAPEHGHRRGTLDGYRQSNEPHQNDA